MAGYTSNVKKPSASLSTSFQIWALFLLNVSFPVLVNHFAFDTFSIKNVFIVSPSVSSTVTSSSIIQLEFVCQKEAPFLFFNMPLSSFHFCSSIIEQDFKQCSRYSQKLRRPKDYKKTLNIPNNLHKLD